MSAKTFYRLFALVPIAVPLALLPITLAGHLLPAPLAVLGMLSGAGLPFYVPFAAVIFWLLRHREAKDHRRWSYWAPIAFSAIVFVVWYFIVPDSSTTERLSKSRGAAIYALALGYFYVAAMHGAFPIARILGVVRPESTGPSPTAA